MKASIIVNYKPLIILLLLFYSLLPFDVNGHSADTSKTDTLMSLDDFFYLVDKQENIEKNKAENKRIDSLMSGFNSEIPQRQLENYHQKAFDYINRFAHVAIVEQEKFRIPASIKLAQGLIESGFGNSKMARSINNHFGIKCSAEQKRQRGRCYTFRDDTEYDKFLKFESAWESYRYHSKMLQSDRYKSLFYLEITDYEGWAIGLQKAGYASDKNYAKKLIREIELYELYEFDE